MTNFIILAIVLILVGAAVHYIRKEKKRGVTCIGCPAAGTCGKNHDGGCSCHAEK